MNTIESPNRAPLVHLASKIFELVSRGATDEQWAEWLRVPLENAAAAVNIVLLHALRGAGADGSAGGWTRGDCVDHLGHGGGQGCTQSIRGVTANQGCRIGSSGCGAGTEVKDSEVTTPCRILFPAGNACAIRFGGEDGKLGLMVASLIGLELEGVFRTVDLGFL
eukprot:g17148.t1